MSAQYCVSRLIGYTTAAAIAMIIGEPAAFYLGRWSYAVGAICAVAFLKSASGWKWEHEP